VSLDKWVVENRVKELSQILIELSVKVKNGKSYFSVFRLV
jgi:hypothetical protein